MQVQCPTCDASYDIDAAVIPADGLRMRCARCRNNWMQKPVSRDKQSSGSIFGITAARPETEQEMGAEVPQEVPPAAPQVPANTPGTVAQDQAAQAPTGQDAVAPEPAGQNAAPASAAAPSDATPPAGEARNAAQSAGLSLDTARILREEAEREQQARRAERTPASPPVIGGETKRVGTSDGDSAGENEEPLIWPFSRASQTKPDDISAEKPADTTMDATAASEPEVSEAQAPKPEVPAPQPPKPEAPTPQAPPAQASTPQASTPQASATQAPKPETPAPQAPAPQPMASEPASKPPAPPPPRSQIPWPQMPKPQPFKPQAPRPFPAGLATRTPTQTAKPKSGNIFAPASSPSAANRVARPEASAQASGKPATASTDKTRSVLQTPPKPRRPFALPARAGVLNADEPETNDPEALTDQGQFDNDFMEDWREDRTPEALDPAFEFHKKPVKPEPSAPVKTEENTANAARADRYMRLQKRRFWAPFWAVVIFAVLSVSLFFAAPYISEQVPDLEPQLAEYVDQVEGLRADLALKAQGFLIWLKEMGESVGT